MLKLPMELWCGSHGATFASLLAVYPIALDPLLLVEHKPGHDFLFPFLFVNAKTIMTV